MSETDRQPPANAMIGVLEGGTDAGSMVIFDPAGLPDDYDGRAHDDPVAVLHQLTTDGTLYWLNESGDGGYRLGVILGAGVPIKLSGFAKHIEDAARFAAPSGRLYFTGIEYVFRRDDSRLRKYPQMGAFLEIPPGVYRLSFYELEYPEDFHDDVLRARLSPHAFRVYSLMSWFVPIGCMSALAVIAAIGALGWRLWAMTVFPVGMCLAMLPFVLARTATYRAVQREHRAIEREYPDYSACLTIVEHDDRH
jgi:hypothetical protein